LAAAVPAGARVLFLSPVAPIGPALGNLPLAGPALTPALPVPGALAPSLGSSLPLVDAMPLPAAVPEAVNAADAVPPSADAAREAAGASVNLAVAADDLAHERGLKAKTMSGAEFVAVVAEAVELSRGSSHARAVQASMLRVVRALVREDLPLAPQMGRLLAVWQVFNQEMSRVAEESGSARAVAAEAALFASQVEDSI
jgi:hypothetical protein